MSLTSTLLHKQAIALFLLSFCVFIYCTDQQAAALRIENNTTIYQKVWLPNIIRQHPILDSITDDELFSPMSLAPFGPGAVDCAVDLCVAFTFDDGPASVTTPKILDELEKAYARATFFVVGNQIDGNSAILRRMNDAGHAVGNHSWDHPNMTRLSVAHIQQQIARTQMAIINTGIPAPRFFRPPYELRNERTRRAVGMPFILWNVDVKDWQQQDHELLAREMLASIKPGSILVLHDTKAVTAKALPIVLNELKGKYHFVTVDELLNIPVNSTDEYFGR